MSPIPAARRFPWENVLTSTALIAVARAALVAAQDWYWARGLHALAVNSVARNVLSALPLAFAACALVALAPRFRRLHLLAMVAFAAFAYLYLTGRLPTDSRPGLRTLDMPLAHAGAALLAIGCALLNAGLGPSARPAPVLSLASMALVLCAILVRAGGLRTSNAERELPNVVLISLDTVRADRLGGRGTSPNIDRFFGTASVQFRAAFAPQPFTLVSHASLMTGLDPYAHGVGASTALAPEIPTLAEDLGRAGYVTLGEVDWIEWLHPRYGFARGFQHYAQRQGTARTRMPALLDLLDDLGDERFFLFLHFYDAHSDRGALAYDSDPADRHALGASLDGALREEPGGGTGLLIAANQGEVVLTESERAEIVRQYDAGVRTLDRALGPLLERLESFLDDTVVILVSDHGEELFEHEKWLHSQLYDESVHVPLLLRLPGRSGVRASDEVAGLIDVAPTVRELCGLAPRNDAVQGRSLVPRFDGANDARDAHVLLEWGGLGLRTREWKLIERTDGRQLFHLISDPAERVDLARSPHVAAELGRLSGVLQAEAARSRALRDTFDAPPLDPLPAEDREALRALGCAGGVD